MTSTAEAGTAIHAKAPSNRPNHRETPNIGSASANSTAIKIIDDNTRDGRFAQWHWLNSPLVTDYSFRNHNALNVLQSSKVLCWFCNLATSKHCALGERGS